MASVVAQYTIIVVVMISVSAFLMRGPIESKRDRAAVALLSALLWWLIFAFGDCIFATAHAGCPLDPSVNLLGLPLVTFAFAISSFPVLFVALCLFWVALPVLWKLNRPLVSTAVVGLYVASLVAGGIVGFLFSQGACQGMI